MTIASYIVLEDLSFNNLYQWILETDDKGRFPESDDALKAVIDRWGEKAVNKEYDRVR